MSRMEDNFIDLTVTSPPYDNLRTYHGFEWGEHVWKPIIEELYRVTKQGGVVVWVANDATIKGSETGTSFKQALYFKECGFNLHDTMIYHSEKPPLTHRRYEQKFEYMFVFSKGPPKTFNPIMEKCKYFGCSLDRPFTSKGSRSDNSAIRSRKISGNRVKQYKIKGNIWLYKTGGGHSTKDKDAFNHPAIFPEKLAKDHILSWSDEGNLVYDPFTGSGTTLKMAKEAGRNYVGSETSVEYFNIAKTRIQKANGPMGVGSLPPAIT